MTGIPKLGHHLEICFSVNDIHDTLEFYKKLGFEIYSGSPDEGWCTIKRDDVYFGLFKDNFIEKEFGVPLLMNYRGGDIDKINSFLREAEINQKEVKLLGEGTGQMIFEDPNGIKFFIDTAPDEERV